MTINHSLKAGSQLISAPQVGQSWQCLELSWPLIRTMLSLYMSGAWAQRSQKIIQIIDQRQVGYISYVCTLQNISLILFNHSKSFTCHEEYYNNSVIGDSEDLIKGARKFYNEKCRICCYWRLAQTGINDPDMSASAIWSFFLNLLLVILTNSLIHIFKRWHIALTGAENHK